jgi:hypothetical protein
MTGPTGGGAPEVGDQLDESAVIPAPKAHVPPLQGVSVEGRARVVDDVHPAVNYATVCGTATATVTITAALYAIRHVNGWVTLAIASVTGGTILALGLIRTSARRKQTEFGDAVSPV